MDKSSLVGKRIPGKFFLNDEKGYPITVEIIRTSTNKPFYVEESKGDLLGIFEIDGEVQVLALNSSEVSKEDVTYEIRSSNGHIGILIAELYL